jgi:hypothetical protein
MTDYATMLRNAYLDEARSDAFFGALADAQPDENRREKLRTLQTIEARTLTSMRRLLENAGVRVETGDARRQGRELAQHVDPAHWEELVRDVGRTVPHDLDRYTGLRDASPSPNDPALRALVNHAQAFARFIDLEGSGETKKSLRALTDYLRKPA